MKRFRRSLAVRQCFAPLLQMTYIFIILALLLAGCTTETECMLRHADSVMEEHPDSAMSILMGIDRKTLKDSDLPYYALLYTQAQVKTDIPLDSDSLISIAYTKYGDKTSGDLGLRSNFYTGEVFFNQEKYREAMPYYLMTYEESKRLGNDYWHAKASERMADLLFFAYNYDEAEQYAQEAADLYRKAGRISNNRYTLGFMSIIQLNNGKTERAYAILDSLHTLVKTEMPVDSAFLTYINLPLLGAGIQTGEIDDDVSRQNLAYDEMSDRKKIDVAILESESSNLHEQSMESLEQMMAFAHSDEDRIHLLYARYENAKAAGKSSYAFSLVDSMLFYQNSVAEDIIKESVTSAQRDFYFRQAIRHEDQTHFLKWMMVLGSVIFLLVVASVVVFFILRNKARNAELQAKLETFLSMKSQSDDNSRKKNSLHEVVEKIGNQKESLASQIMELQNANKDHNEIIEKLFREKWDTLDKLCDQYYGLGNSELSAKDLVANMQKEVKKVVSKKGLKQIVDAVDLYMGGIIKALRTQCPFLKEDHIDFLALLYAGFTTRAVCMFTGTTYDYFYVKKSRLIKRIESSDAPDKALFLEKLK